MNNVFNNELATVITPLFITLYALNLGKIRLPTYIINLFKNTIFKIAFLSLLLIYRFENSPHVALTVAIIFVITLDYISHEECKENFAYMEAVNSK